MLKPAATTERELLCVSIGGRGRLTAGKAPWFGGYDERLTCHLLHPGEQTAPRGHRAPKGGTALRVHTRCGVREAAVLSSALTVQQDRSCVVPHGSHLLNQKHLPGEEMLIINN